MKFLYWFLKGLLLFGAIHGGEPVFEYTGWWGVIAIIGFMVFGQLYLDRKLSALNQQKITEKFPLLKQLESGDRVTLELKNGKVYSNFIFEYFDEHHVIVSTKTIVEQVLQGKDDSKWINLSKVIAVRQEE